MENWVHITFDCVPLRSIQQLPSGAEASPKFQQLVQRIQSAMDRHGRHNSYYLHNAQCVFHLTNTETVGMLRFGFEGTVLTNANDMKTQVVDIDVVLLGDTCDWLTEPIVQWFETTVRKAVKAEFDRYISAGDLDRTRERIEELQQATENSGGFLGMGL